MMSITNLQQTIRYRQEAIYNMSMAVYDPKFFSDWLNEQYQNSHFKSHSDLASAAGLQRSTVNGLINSKVQITTNRSSRPKPETVIKLAKALKADVNIALLKAGHAPIEPSDARPKDFFEFLTALESLGLEQFNFSADPNALHDMSENDYEELLDRIKADIDITLRRKTR